MNYIKTFQNAQTLSEAMVMRPAVMYTLYATSSENCFKNTRQEKEKSRAAGHSDNIQTEQTSRKRFRCGSQYHLIATFPKLPKDNEKRRKQVHFNEKGNHECDNSKNNRD